MIERLVARVVEGVSRKATRIVKDVKPPQFTDVILGGIPPEIIATTMSAEKLLTGDISVDNSIDHYINADSKNGWVSECRIRFLLTNKRSLPLRILGINPGKTRCDIRPASSVLFPAQGALMGEAIRFECDLDKNQPSMRRFDLVDFSKRYRSGEYYFDEGFIEIEPERTNFFSIIFTAKAHAYRIQPYIVYQTGKNVETLTIPLDREVYIYPAKDINSTELFRKSFSLEPPYIVRDQFVYQSVL